MTKIEELGNCSYSDVVLTIGNFDGIHLGHQAILRAARRWADRLASRVVVLTFEPHPLAVLTPEHVPPTLTPLPMKERLLKAAGADDVVALRSTPSLFQTPPMTFVDDVIVKHFAPAAIVEGSSFRFGQHRQGKVEDLEAAGQSRGFETEIIEPTRISLGSEGNTVVSSSLIRQLLLGGTVSQVSACLGRHYMLAGKVVHGAGRGTGLGFPTANIQPEDQLVPAEGVYAGSCELDGRAYPAAISIGQTPTFERQDTIIEGHILDFDGDLYDQRIELSFLQWLREQRRYDSGEALCEQMSRDLAETRRVFRANIERGSTG
jgi:riboflavin kinase/FMN adenylyltransferase